MDYETLVDFDLESGKKVLRALKDDGVTVDLAFWAKLSIYDNWKLFLASSTFDRAPILDAYTRTALATVGKFVFSKPPVVILRSTDPLIQGVRDEVSSRETEHGARIQSREVGGRYIEDSYVY